METEVVQPGETGQENFFTPETAEEFQRLVEEELGTTLIETTEDEVSAQSLLWRGHNPREVVGLLEGQLDGIEIHSDKPNVTLDWHQAIAYNSGGEGVRYNTAMGFMPPDDWDSRPGIETVSSDLLEHREIYEGHRKTFVGNGRIIKHDVRYLVVRPHGGRGKDVGLCRFYKVAA